MDKKVTNLIKNTGIFAIANMLTKVIMFVMIPVYTYYLTTEEYGIVDTVTTTASLLLPIMTVSIFEAVLRFGMKKEIDQKIVLSNALFMVLISCVALIVVYPLTVTFESIHNYYLPFCLVLIFDELINILNAFSKSIGKVAVSAKVSVFRTVLYVVLGVAFVIVIKGKTFGYLYAYALSQLCAVLYYILIQKFYKYIEFRIDFSMLRQMLVYSLPLMVNGMMWWVMQSSDKYGLIYFQGMDANGIYSVANKVPSIMTLIHSTFFQAWQLSAIEEYDSKDSSHFYSKIFDKYVLVSFVAGLGLIVLIKPILVFVLESSYKTAWRYTYFLVLASIFSSFSSFYGTIYSASEKTKGAFFTSCLGATGNIVLNLILIPFYGIQGAAIATFISYFIMWFVRTFDTRKYRKIDFNKQVLIIDLIGSISTVVLLLVDNNAFFITGTIIGSAVCLYNIILLYPTIKKGLMR